MIVVPHILCDAYSEMADFFKFPLPACIIMFLDQGLQPSLCLSNIFFPQLQEILYTTDEFMVDGNLSLTMVSCDHSLAQFVKDPNIEFFTHSDVLS